MFGSFHLLHQRRALTITEKVAEIGRSYSKEPRDHPRSRRRSAPVPGAATPKLLRAAEYSAFAPLQWGKSARQAAENRQNDDSTEPWGQPTGVAVFAKATAWHADYETTERTKREHPSKLVLAVRLRQETALSIKQIAERLHLGKPRGARTNLRKFVNGPTADTAQSHLGIE